LGGWHASLAQMLGLWVTESGLTGRKKKWATKAILKIIPTLLKWDSSDNHFNQHSMNTGYYGIAKKQVL
jgi:hypothetical protein